MMHSQRLLFFLPLVFILCAFMGASNASDPEKTNDFVTQTVYGFLDFTTTIGKTVMIFSPQSAPSLDLSIKPTKQPDIIQTKPLSDKGKSPEIAPTKLSTSENQIKKATSQKNEVARKDYSNQPDYDLLSRQPEAYAEESYHVVDIVSKKKSGSRRTTAKDPHPVGLVTTINGKVAKDGTTTIHETSVIGTYISGKYAQVLQSNFHVLSNNNHQQTVSPTSTLRVLRTESPNLQSSIRHFNGGQLGRNKNRGSSSIEQRVVTSTLQAHSHSSNRKHGSGGKHKANKGHQKNKTSKVLRSSQRETDRYTSTSASHDTRRYPSFRQKLQPVTTSSTSSVVTPTNIKLRPVGRWQYKSTLKPRVYIRKATDLSSSISPTQAFSTSNEIETNTALPSLTEAVSQPLTAKIDNSLSNVTAESEAAELAAQFPVETINIDIVTPSNFEDVYYEIATIKTPYTFQMGGVKKTRYVTVTSTSEKHLESEYIDKSTIKGPLIENILAPTTPISQLLQASSITTFSPCTLADTTETPSLDEFIETYTQSQMKLKTQVFPIVGANQSTSYLTVLQTYDITTVITATQTTPVCIGNNFNEFNSKLDEAGSELHLDLEFGDLANSEQEDSKSKVEVEASSISSIIPNEVTSKKPPTEERPPQNYYPQYSPEQLQQLAYLKLFNPNAQLPQLPQLVNPPEEVVPEEPLYESHIIPIVNGKQTSYRTISKLIARPEKATPVLPLPQPLPTINPFGLQQPQFTLITSPIVRPTVLTQTHSRILKLTFGAKTALTTIFSTNVVSTDVATFVTTSIPVQPTASIPNFFPPVFPQYPFLG